MAKTTKFEITMTVNVENRSVMSKMDGLLHITVKEAIESLGDGEMIQIIEMTTSQKTFPKGLTEKQQIDAVLAANNLS